MPEKKICDVIIRGNKYPLVDIPGKINNDKSTLWIRKDKDLFEDNIEYIPWTDFNTNRKCWTVSIRQGNSMKYKYDEWEIKGHTAVTLSLNNTAVYEFDTNNLEFAFNKAQHLIYKLQELPITLDNLTEDVGRNIFYKGLPCKVSSRSIEGTMIINPDCKDEDLDDWWNSFADPWYDEHSNEWLEEWKSFGEMKVDILSEHIHWYRNDREIKLNKLKKHIKKGT
jgi:hypothetical protein